MSEAATGVDLEAAPEPAPGGADRGDAAPGVGRPRRRLPWWTLLVAALVAALVVGSGVLSPSPPTPAQRALAIESSIRCPSCEDLSVADSSAPTAVTVRATVRRLVAEGRSDAQIESYLASRYGSSIVLVPPTSGWSLLVWALPVAGGAVAVAGLVVVLVRRRRSAERRPDPGEARRWAESVASATGRVGLEAQRAFLARSLADAEAEHRAGDLTDADHAALVARDGARLAAVEACLSAPEVGAEGPTTPSSPEETRRAVRSPKGARPEPRRRPLRQRVLLGGAVTAFTAAAVLGVALVATHRLPGQTATGSISLSRQQRLVEMLDQAATEENAGHLGLATRLYQKVLASDSTNEVALAQLGWLEYETGVAGSDASLAASGRAKLERAVSLVPGDYAARLYLGTALSALGGKARAAVAQFDAFLADHPPASLVAQAAPVLRRAYAAAGVPLPATVPAG